MTLAVAFLPDTPLLVPGVAGRADPLADLRAAALTALAPRDDAEAAAPVLVLAPGPADRTVDGARASFGAIGVPAHLLPAHSALADPAPVPGGAVLPAAAHVGAAPTGPVAATPAPVDAAASTALALLAAAGRTGPVRVAEIARPATRAAALRERGRALVGDLPTGALVVVVGSLSARDGADAPLAADPRAGAADAALLAALAAGPDALAAVLDVREDLRPGPDGLAVSGWAPWQVLLGLLDGLGGPGGPGGPVLDGSRVPARTTGTALGTHAVAAWRLGPAPGPDLPEGRVAPRTADPEPARTTPEEHR